MKKESFYNADGSKWAKGPKFAKVDSEHGGDSFVPIECNIWNECKNCGNRCAICHDGLYYDQDEEPLGDSMKKFIEVCKKSQVEWGKHYSKEIETQYRRSKTIPKYEKNINDSSEEAKEQFTYILMGDHNGCMSSTGVYACANTRLRLDVFIVPYWGDKSGKKWMANCVLESDVLCALLPDDDYREGSMFFTCVAKLKRFLDKWARIKESLLFLDDVIGPHHEA